MAFKLMTDIRYEEGRADERRVREADIEALYRSNVDEAIITSIYQDSGFDLPAIKARALALR